MPDLRKGNLHIRPITRSDGELLFSWRNSHGFMSNCTHRSKVESLQDFEQELERDFSFDRHKQFLIIYNEIPIGTIFSYSFNPNDKYCFITVFIAEKYRGRGYAIISLLLFARWLFDTYGLFKTYYDVYEYNPKSHNLFLKCSIPLEGCFKKQKILNSKRYDVFRFALYQEDVQNLIRRFFN